MCIVSRGAASRALQPRLIFMGRISTLHTVSKCAATIHHTPMYTWSEHCPNRFGNCQIKYEMNQRINVKILFKKNTVKITVCLDNRKYILLLLVCKDPFSEGTQLTMRYKTRWVETLLQCRVLQWLQILCKCHPRSKPLPSPRCFWAY